MAKRDPEKVIEDIEDYRCDGDRERLMNEIMSSMDVEFESDTKALVKQTYLGLVSDGPGPEKLTFDLSTWEMEWFGREAMWVVVGWGPDETYFQVDFIKDRIPWKKVRGLLFETDEECAAAIADNGAFQNHFAETTAEMGLDEDTGMYSVIRDPLLRKALTPEKD